MTDQDNKPQPAAESNQPAKSDMGSQFRVALAAAAASEGNARVAAQETLLSGAAQEARIIREARMPDKGRLTEEQHAYWRERLRIYIKEHGITIDFVAKQMAYGSSTISQFLSGLYAGDVDKLCRKAANWIEQHARGENSGMPREYVPMPVAEHMINVCQHVQQHAKMGLVIGPSGVSKTLVCKAIASGGVPGISSAIHIPVVCSDSTPAGFCRLLCQRAGVKPISRGFSENLHRLIDALSGTNRMLLIDDAQRLSADAAEVGLDVHKQAGVPIVWFDTHDFDRMAHDHDRWFGQFSRNILFRYDVTEGHTFGGTPLYSVDDVLRLAGKMGLRLTGQAAEWLSEISSIPSEGGLGIATALLINGGVAARKMKSDVIDLVHLQAAWVSLKGTSHFETLENARRSYVDGLRIKTA